MMPMQPPRTLLLDFDGVLARYSRPDRMRHLADHAGCSPGQVHAALFSVVRARVAAGESVSPAALAGDARLAGIANEAGGLDGLGHFAAAARRGGAVDLREQAIAIVEAWEQRLALGLLGEDEMATAP